MKCFTYEVDEAVREFHIMEDHSDLSKGNVWFLAVSISKELGWVFVLEFDGWLNRVQGVETFDLEVTEHDGFSLRKYALAAELMNEKYGDYIPTFEYEMEI